MKIVRTSQILTATLRKAMSGCSPSSYCVVCGSEGIHRVRLETVETSTRLSLRMPTEWTTLLTTTPLTPTVAAGSQLAITYIRPCTGQRHAFRRPEVMSSASKTGRFALSRIGKKRNSRIRCTGGVSTRTLPRTIFFCSSCFFGWVVTVCESLGSILTVP